MLRRFCVTPKTARDSTGSWVILDRARTRRGPILPVGEGARAASPSVSTVRSRIECWARALVRRNVRDWPRTFRGAAVPSIKVCSNEVVIPAPAPGTSISTQRGLLEPVTVTARRHLSEPLIERSSARRSMEP